MAREEYGSLLPTAFVNGVTAPVTSSGDCDDGDLETVPMMPSCDDFFRSTVPKSDQPNDNAQLRSTSSNLRPLRIASTALVLLGAAVIMVSAGVARGVLGDRPSSPVELPTAPTVQRAAAPADAATDDEGSDGEVFEEYTIVLSDLVVRPEVQTFLALHDVSHDDNETVLLKYLPGKLVFRLWPDRAAGALGADAVDGVVAVNIKANGGSVLEPGNDKWISSWLVVTSLRGELLHFSPTFLAASARADGAVGTLPPTRATQMNTCALKPHKPGNRLLLGGNNGTSEEGPLYIFDLDTGSYELTAGGVVANCHDAQWKAGGTEGGSPTPAPEGFWRPNSGGSSALWLSAADDGQRMCTVSLDYNLVDDINHAQFVEHDTVVYVSSRLTDAVIKVEIDGICAVDSGADDDFPVDPTYAYVLGGDSSTCVIVDGDGETHDPGYSLFQGQHNVEFYGHNDDGLEEIMLVDNQYGSTRSSRLLVINVDASADAPGGTGCFARVDWELDLHAHMPVYGDFDRLPSGNFLGMYYRIIDKSVGPLERDPSAVNVTAADAAAGRARNSGRDRLQPLRLARDDDSLSAGGDDSNDGGPAAAASADDATEDNSEFGLRVFEIVRGTKLPAWEMDVFGVACPRDGNEGTGAPACASTSWQAYSAERLYSAPLVTNITYTTGGAGARFGGNRSLAFSAFNSVKEQNAASARYAVYARETAATVTAGGTAGGGDDDDDVHEYGRRLARGVFTFRPHWQRSDVHVALPSELAAPRRANLTLIVTNLYGERTIKTVVH